MVTAPKTEEGQSLMFTTTTTLLAAATCAISVMGITAPLASAADRQPIRFLTYDLVSARAGHYDTKLGKFKTPLEAGDSAALGVPAQKLAAKELDLKVIKLLKSNLPNAQFETTRSQLIQEDADRFFAYCVKLENISRARMTKACAVASGLMGKNADFMVDLSEVFYGADKVKSSGPDVTEKIIQLDGPQSKLSLAQSPKPINVSVGFFSYARIKDSSPFARKQVINATKTLANLVATNKVCGALTANAKEAGITGQKLEELKAKTKAYLDSVNEISKKKAKDLSLDTDVKTAAALVARENDLDIVMSTDQLSGNLDLLGGSAFVDVNDKMFNAFEALTNKRRASSL